MDSLHESELKLFVDTVRRYFNVLTRQEPQVTSAFLAKPFSDDELKMALLDVTEAR